jgi:hypothetical protein
MAWMPARTISQKCRLEHHESHQARGERADRGVFTGDRPQQEGHREVEPGDDQQQRDGAEVVDVQPGNLRQQRVVRQTHQGQDSAQGHAAEHAQHHQLEGHQQAVGQARQGGDDRGEIHHLPPTEIRPGTATFCSTRRMNSIRLMFRVK